jgi:selenide,water dikinase
MIVRDLVLLGGGHSHLFVLKAFGMRPIRGLRLTLVSEQSTAAYSGMLPGLVAGHYDFDESHIDLRKLAAFADARFVRAKIVGLDADSRQVLLEGRPPLSYDLCSINIGGLPAMPPGVSRWARAVAVKPVPRLLLWLEDLERQVRVCTRPAEIAVIGAGAGGVELALALAHRFHGREVVSVSLIEQASDILPGSCKRRHRRSCRREAGSEWRVDPCAVQR